MNPNYTTFTSTGSKIVHLDRTQSPFNVSVGVVYSSTAVACTYGIEFTMNDINYNTLIGSTNPTSLWLPDANLPAGTSSGATTNYMFPVCAVRCTVTAISGGFAVFQVLQGGSV